MEYTEYIFAEHGKRRYTLSEDTISVITGRQNFSLPLQELEPDYDVVRLRSSTFYVGLVGAALALVLLLVGKSGVVGVESADDVVALAVIIGGLSLLILCLSWKKIERALFPTTSGREALAISHTGPDRQEFQLFVEELSRRIRRTKSAGPPPEPHQSL